MNNFKKKLLLFTYINRRALIKLIEGRINIYCYLHIWIDCYECTYPREGRGDDHSSILVKNCQRPTLESPSQTHLPHLPPGDIIESLSEHSTVLLRQTRARTVDLSAHVTTHM